MAGSLTDGGTAMSFLDKSRASRNGGWMRKRFALLLSLVALAFGAAGASPGGDAVFFAGAAYAKSCGAGWTHAGLSWGHKCLRRGQFCKSDADGEYHRHGFHCHTGRLQ